MLKPLHKRLLSLWLLVIIAFIYAPAQDKNPFQSIGKKGKVVTLSQGKYDEFFDADSIQLIGTALVNVWQMKVAKLLENEEEAQRFLDNSTASRFLSVDPLTKGYPELTPYQFASNSPISGIDLDGLEFSWATDWLADKAKAAGNPRLSGFIRSFGAGDLNRQAFELLENTRKGNFKALGQQVYGYTLPGLVNGLGTTTKAAIKGDKEAQGQLLGMGAQALFGGIYSVKGGL